MLNEQQFMSKWEEIKTGVRNLWGRLTDEDLEMTKGSLTSIAGLVEKNYGEAKEEIRTKLKTLMASFENPTDKGNSPDISSFERTPSGVRTSELSQNQDSIQALARKTSSTKKLDEKSFDARKKNLGSASYNGTGNNTPSEGLNSEDVFDEGRVARNGTSKSSINQDGSSDRIARH